MHDKIKDRWVAALRSGDYPQTIGYLNIVEQADDREVGHCCLGVLCDLAEKEGVVTSVVIPSSPEAKVPGYREFHGKKGWDQSCGALPDAVAEWAGLLTDAGNPQDDPSVQGEDGSSYSLTDVNDSQGMSFTQIADLIEKHL